MKYALALLISLISLCAFTSPSNTDQFFVVYERGAKVCKAEICRDDTSNENIVEIEALNVSGGSIAISRKNSVFPPAEISSIISINGSYVMSREIRKSCRGAKFH